MNSLRLATKALAVLIVVGLSTSAFASRYIVVMKNAMVFQQIHSQVSLSSGSTMSSLTVVMNGKTLKPFAGSDAVVEDSLAQLHSIIVNSEDDSAVAVIKASGQALVIEKEFFHPAPRPVSGYSLTKPWDFSLQYAKHYVSGSTPHLMDNYSKGTGPKTPWGIIAVNAPQAWEKANYGRGARVAVIDTGIDKDHPALAANFEQGRDFIHDGNTPYPFADKVGHGSHCAGTIAGVQSADGFTGVAPEAKILSGRVCSEQGCSNIAVAQGINWAISQKVDVISMSLGGANASAAEQSAVESADRAKIVVVAASGNDGVGQVGFPAAFPSVIAVGAIDRNSKKGSFSQWGPELAVVAPGVEVVSSVPQGTGRESRVTVNVNGSDQTISSSAFQGSPEVPNQLTADLIYAGLGQPEDFQKLDLTGKIALVQRGTIRFSDKVKNAIAANAIGVIIFNNEAGLITSGGLTQDGSIVAIPVLSIEQTVGQQLASALGVSKKVTSTIQTVATDYESFSGTSMAAPHVAGVSALLRATNKNLTGADVKKILKSTAHALQPNDENQTGSGLIDAEAAVNQAVNN